MAARYVSDNRAMDVMGEERWSAMGTPAPSPLAARTPGGPRGARCRAATPPQLPPGAALTVPQGTIRLRSQRGAVHLSESLEHRGVAQLGSASALGAEGP